MTEFIHLIGAEDVQRAGSNIRSSADTIQQAANTITAALEQHSRFMDD